MPVNCCLDISKVFPVCLQRLVTETEKGEQPHIGLQLFMFQEILGIFHVLTEKLNAVTPSQNNFHKGFLCAMTFSEIRLGFGKYYSKNENDEILIFVMDSLAVVSMRFNTNSNDIFQVKSSSLSAKSRRNRQLKINNNQPFRIIIMNLSQNTYMKKLFCMCIHCYKVQSHEQ